MKNPKGSDSIAGKILVVVVVVLLVLWGVSDFLELM